MATLALITFLLLIFFLLRKFANAKLSANAHMYPPGPRPIPIMGNLFDFPKRDASRVFLEWSRRHQSGILHASSFGKHFVILNKVEEADELLERRSRKYSDRIQLPILKLMGWGSTTGQLPYGDEWRFHRKFFQRNFRPDAMHNYNPLLTKKVHDFLRHLLDAPDHFVNHNLLLSMSIPMAAMYDYDAKSANDPIIQAAHKITNIVTPLLFPGANLVNSFPVLEHLPSWLPRLPSQNLLAKGRDISDRMENTLFEHVKDNLERGSTASSYLSQFLLRKQLQESLDEDEASIRNLAFSVFIAASETTISSLGTFFYLMCAYPDVQHKAQAEIEAVVGTTRLPGFKDRSDLPYIEAIYRELLRFQPPAPLGVSHRLLDDDVYKEYFLPKGSEVIANIWAMTHDEEVYPEPFQFKPERYLDEAGNLNGDSRILAYGFGRRVCAGKHMASSLLWFTIVSVLASFNLEKAKDEHGDEFEFNHEFDTSRVVVHKTPFKCSIAARNTRIIEFLKETCETF